MHNQHWPFYVQLESGTSIHTLGMSVTLAMHIFKAHSHKIKSLYQHMMDVSSGMKVQCILETQKGWGYSSYTYLLSEEASVEKHLMLTTNIQTIRAMKHLYSPVSHVTYQFETLVFTHSYWQVY